MKFKIGDLIYDRDFPEDGYALIIEVREPRNRRGRWWKGEDGYRCLEAHTGKTHWFTIAYIEEECAMVKADKKCPGQKSTDG